MSSDRNLLRTRAEHEHSRVTFVELFKCAIARKLRTSHLVGLALLVLLIPVASVVTPLALLLAATLVLVGIAAWEALLRHRRRVPQLVRTGVHQG